MSSTGICVIAFPVSLMWGSAEPIVHMKGMHASWRASGAPSIHAELVGELGLTLSLCTCRPGGAPGAHAGRGGV